MENKPLMPEDSEPKYSRRSRSLDNRDSDDRAASERPPIVFGNQSRFNLPESVLADKRYEFGWTPYMLRNEEMHQKFDDSMAKGWECVEASEYPQLRRTYKYDPFRKRTDGEEESIKVGGQICVKRKIEIKEAEDKHFNEENFHRQQMVDVHKMDSPGGTRVFSHSRTRSSRAEF